MHWTGMPRHSLLSRDRPLLGELDDVLGVDTDRGPGRAGAYTGGTALQSGADIALHGRLGDLFLRPAADPTQQAHLRGHFSEVDHPIGAVLDTIATTDA